jgi:hypothetical protein
MNSQDFNLYLNFLLYAILGRMGEADGIIEQSNGGIKRSAKYISNLAKIKTGKIYRGILLEPNQMPEDQLVKAIPSNNFVSFSEDKDVACWFGYKTSTISGYVSQIRPNVEGWIAEYTPKNSEILFHYKWIPALNRLVEMVTGAPSFLHLSSVMVQNVPDMDALQASQIEWNLKTQKEVMIEPHKEIEFVEIEKSNCSPLSGLENKFTHPMFRGMRNPSQKFMCPKCGGRDLKINAKSIYDVHHVKRNGKWCRYDNSQPKSVRDKRIKRIKKGQS